jgi:hypothetical protein
MMPPKMFVQSEGQFQKREKLTVLKAQTYERTMLLVVARYSFRYVLRGQLENPGEICLTYVVVLE